MKRERETALTRSGLRKSFAGRSAWEWVLVVAVALTLLAAVWTFLPQGVTQNDEVQNRFDRKIGLWYFIVQNLGVHMDKGRILAIPTDWRFLGFLFDEMFFNRMICAAMIVVNAILMGVILSKLRRDKGFGLFYAVAVVLLMPLTMEHAAPAVFTPIVATPMFLLQVSVLFYLECLNGNSKYRRAELWAIVFFLLAMTCYEFMVTYVLLYPVLYIYVTLRDGGNLTLKGIVQNSWKYIMTCVLYIIAYFLMLIIRPSIYDGNSLTFVSFASSFAIIKQLFLSAVPGYFFVLNSKYKYLMYYYNGGLLNAGTLFTFRMAVVILGTVLIAAAAVSGRKRRNKLLVSLGAMTVAFAYMLLPSLPNALSSMYQGQVTDTWFTSLPVSYFLHFAGVLLLVQFIWLVLEQLPIFPGLVRVGVVVCFLGVVMCQQSFNHIICQQQTEAYDRMVFMEECMATEALGAWEGKTLYSEDMHEVRGLLAFHDGYWNRVAALSGHEVNIVGTEAAAADAVIQVDENVMQIWSEDNTRVTLLTNQVLQGTYLMLGPDNQAYAAHDVNPNIGDGDLWVMYLEWDAAHSCFVQVK